MQAGSAVQDELIDFISASRRDDLAKLLRYAGELLPPGGGGDGIAAHRSVLMGYLTRAPGHLVLALRDLLQKRPCRERGVVREARPGAARGVQ